MTDLLTMKLRIDPLVRVLSATGTATPHLEVYAVEMRDSQQRDRIHIDGGLARQTGAEFTRRNVVALEAHHDLVIACGPGDDAQQLGRRTVGPHGERARGLAGRIVALPYTKGVAEDVEDIGQQEAFRRTTSPEDTGDLLCGGIAQGQSHLPPQRRGHRWRIENAPLEHHGEAIDRLAGVDEHRFVDQGMDQGRVAVKGICPGIAQAQRRRNQGVPSGA